jgi:guanine nucleotide-binding protein subunit alpha
VLRQSVKEALRREKMRSLDVIESQAAKERSKKIDLSIHRDRLLARNDVKLVLFGIDHSGKSELINQIKKGSGFKESAEELEKYRLLINRNIIQKVHILIEALESTGQLPEIVANREYCELLSNYTFREDIGMTLELDIGEAIASLWRDPSVAIIRKLVVEYFREPVS